MTNRDFIERTQSFYGNLEEWFSKCVKPTDLFRVWFKDGIEECSYYYFNDLIKINDKYLIGLIDYECKTGQESVYYTYFNEIKDFELLTNEEDL